MLTQCSIYIHCISIRKEHYGMFTAGKVCQQYACVYSTWTWSVVMSVKRKEGIWKLRVLESWIQISTLVTYKNTSTNHWWMCRTAHDGSLRQQQVLTPRVFSFVLSFLLLCFFLSFLPCFPLFVSSFLFCLFLFRFFPLLKLCQLLIRL